MRTSFFRHAAVVAQLRRKFALNEEVFRVLFTLAGTEGREVILSVMASFNKVILMGNLTRDPELRYTPKGTAIAKIGLAVNRVWTNEAGEKKEEVTFVDVDVFGRTAENVGQYMRKGRPILIEGRSSSTSGTTSRPARKRASSASWPKLFNFSAARPVLAKAAVPPAAPRAAAAGTQRARRRTRRGRRAARKRRCSVLIFQLATFNSTKLFFVWQKLKSSSPTTSSASAVNPTRSASPPVTRATIFPAGSRFR
jgi:single-stranded DNA-binding protein